MKSLFIIYIGKNWKKLHQLSKELTPLSKIEAQLRAPLKRLNTMVM